MLTVFYQTLDARRPKWLLNESLIGSNPGNYLNIINYILLQLLVQIWNNLFIAILNRFLFFLLLTGLGFRPMPPPSNVESTLIWYKSNDKGNVAYWQKELDEFLKSKWLIDTID